MFGQSFKYQKPLKDADIGEYKVKITRIQKFEGETSRLEFDIEYADGIARNPSRFSIFDLSPQATESQRNAFNYKLSRFQDCFGWYDSFDEPGLFKLIGKTGTVYISRDKNGYMNVSQFLIE